jgi:hypothetical protein
MLRAAGDPILSGRRVHHPILSIVTTRRLHSEIPHGTTPMLPSGHPSGLKPLAWDLTLYNPRVTTALSPRMWGGAQQGQMPSGTYNAHTPEGDKRFVRPITVHDYSIARRCPWDVSAGGFGGLRGGLSSSPRVIKEAQWPTLPHAAQPRAILPPAEATKGVPYAYTARSLRREHAIRAGPDGLLTQSLGDRQVGGFDIAFGGPPQMVP